MIHFIKKELIIFSISAVFFGGAFYLYQSQDMNIAGKKDELSSIKSSIMSEKKKLKKTLLEYKKEENFETEIKKLHIIKKPETFEVYDVRKKFISELNMLFGTDFKIKFKTVPNKERFRKYISYNVKIVLKYNNKYSIQKFLEWLNSNFVYKINQVDYKISKSNGILTLDLNLLGKKGNKRRHRRR